MLKLNKRCKVCLAVKQDKKLLEAIFQTTYYLPNSGISLQAFSKLHEDKFRYESLLNHVKQHQFMDESDFTERTLQQINKKTLNKNIERVFQSKEVWDEVITEGMRKMQKGELSMKTSDLLKAAKDKSDYEMKVKDQQLAMMEMVYHFASGENNESRSYDRRRVRATPFTDNDPATELTGHPEDGTDGPSGVYYPPAWDAAALGPNQVSEGDDSQEDQSQHTRPF